MDPRHFDTHRDICDESNPLDDLIAKEESELDETIDISGIREIPRDALHRLVSFLILSGKTGNPKIRWRQATVRLALLGQMMDIDGLGSKSLQQLGDELGLTKASLSLASLRMIDSLGIEKTLNGKQRHAREAYRQAALAYHRRAGHRLSEDMPEAKEGHQEAADSV